MCVLVSCLNGLVDVWFLISFMRLVFVFGSGVLSEIGLVGSVSIVCSLFLVRLVLVVSLVGVVWWFVCC